MKLITLGKFNRGINGLWNKIKLYFATKTYVDEKVGQLDDYTVDTIVPTTTNFISGETYTIHTALQRIANLFAGNTNKLQTEVLDKIPNQATSINQLADKAFVNSTVATNAANFRGNWANWNSVPTDATLYPEDYTGSRTPTNNDYLVVRDGTDYQPEYTGMWRFIYIGTWSVIGKSGWKPQYRVGQAFTAAQQAAIDSNITSALTQQITTNQTNIGDLQTNKVTIDNTAKKIYGTDKDGRQIVYTAGNNVQFNDNGTISATDTIYDDTQVRGLISAETQNRINADTQLQNNINTKQDILIPTSDIEISGSAISTTHKYSIKKTIVDPLN